jgi:CRP-like cAMP-binding protein
MNRADYIQICRSAAAVASGNDKLLLLDWADADWDKLLDCTHPQRFRASEVVIQRGAADRVLYFVAAGSLEVGITQVDGVSIAPLAKILPGSVVGEQSFFDGEPRSANVWGVSDGELLRLEFDAFHRFASSEPALSRDLLFALARVLSTRLRNTTFRVRR